MFALTQKTKLFRKQFEFYIVIENDSKLNKLRSGAKHLRSKAKRITPPE